MAERPLAYHASPPAGHWLNDPNGLVYVDGAYRLFAQHRSDAPEFRETGWARFSSPDLLRWTFDGAVIFPSETDWAYSGCIASGEADLEVIYTAHSGQLERQVCRTSVDGGQSWGPAEEVVSLGSPATNRRDPYVFRDGAGWALLLAEPCDWTDWPTQPPSRLRLYRSPDRRAWRQAGAIGPWRPEGIMWEVPLLARLDGYDVLFISEIDRRAGGATCSVSAWIGALEETGFVPLPGQPETGQRVDYGPDFYALMASVESGWPAGDRAFIGWLSNWQAARAMPWPGFHGGPISLPRALGIDTTAAVPRLTSRPHPAVSDCFTRSVGGFPLSGRGCADLRSAGQLLLTVAASDNRVVLDVDWSNGKLVVERFGALPWRQESGFSPSSGRDRTVQIFLDGPAIEFFMLDEGMSVSIALGTNGSRFVISAQVDGLPVAFVWQEAG